jgi:hypothetical protein
MAGLRRQLSPRKKGKYDSFCRVKRGNTTGLAALQKEKTKDVARNKMLKTTVYSEGKKERKTTAYCMPRS